MIKLAFIIGIGGFLGSIFRFLTDYFISKSFPHIFPFGTLTVNIVGCFLIGTIYSLAEKENLMTNEMRLFLVTGICGGFTTFSAFAMDNLKLINSSAIWMSIIYIVLSVLLGILGVFAGINISRLLN